jgi:hypothetical protein
LEPRSRLDTLLQTFWIPLVTQVRQSLQKEKKKKKIQLFFSFFFFFSFIKGVVDASQMPTIFGNVELIATVRVFKLMFFCICDKLRFV